MQLNAPLLTSLSDPGDARTKSLPLLSRKQIPPALALLVAASTVASTRAASAEEASQDGSALEGEEGLKPKKGREAAASSIEPTGQPTRDEEESNIWRFGKVASALTVTTSFVALNTWAYFAWYKERATLDHIVWEKDGLFGPNTYAGGSDKLGHLWVNYVMNRMTSSVLQRGGWSPVVSSSIATVTTMGFFTFIEIKDGLHEGYGFSWNDMIFNGIGNGLAVLFDAVPVVDELFDLKVYYVPSSAFFARVKEQGPLNAGEDYSAQTFTLDLHLGALPGVDRAEELEFLKFLDLSVGYRSLNYLPEPVEPNTHRLQELSFAVSINMQHLLNLAYGYESGRRRTSHGILNFGAEVLGMPLTRFPFAKVQKDSGVADDEVEE